METHLYSDNMTAYENFTCGKWNLTEKEDSIQKEHGWWVQGIASVITGCCGVIANILLLIVLFSPSFRKIFFNKLIITLTVSDTMFLVCNVYESLHLYFISTSYCGIPGYIQFISYPFRKITMCFSIYMAVILTFERYRAVTTPIAHRITLMSSSWIKHFMKYLSPVFLVSCVIYGTPLFFAFKMEPYHIDPSHDINRNITLNTTDNISIRDQKEPGDATTIQCMTIWWRTDKMYILLYNNLTNFIITGAIPFIWLLSLNAKIYVTIRESLIVRRQLNIRQASRRYDIEETHESQNERHRGIDILQTLVLFGLVISFFFCHILRIVLNLEEIIYFEEINRIQDMEEKLNLRCTGVQFWTMIAGDLSHLLLQVNSSINILIYGCISTQFKKALRKKLSKCMPFLQTSSDDQRQDFESKTNNFPLTEMRSENINTNE